MRVALAANNRLWRATAVPSVIDLFVMPAALAVKSVYTITVLFVEQ